MKKKLLLGLLSFSAILSLASCSKKEFTVTFESNSGSTVESLVVTEEGLIAKPANPTKEGYTFAGWFLDANFATEVSFENFKVTENVTLYAKWTINTYTVTFNSNGGSNVAAQKINHGSAVTVPATAPTKEGYTFVGWFTDEALTTQYTNGKITSDVTLYAKWTKDAVIYVVTFNTDGGSEIASQNVTEGEAATLPTTNPTKVGYTFEGWFLDAACTNQYTNQAINAATTLYAKWVEVVETVYTVTFNTKGGSEIAAQQVKEDEWGSFTVQKPTDPTQAYKTFAGWFTDEACTAAFDFSSEITSNITLYAKWNSEYEMVTTVADFDAGAEAFPGKAKPTEAVTIGRFTFNSGVYFEAATSSKTACVNNQQKDISFELTGRTNSITFNIKYGSSGSGGVLTLYKLDADGNKVEVKAWNESGQNDYEIANLEAGSYVFGSVGSYRFYSLSITEELEKSAPKGLEIASMPQVDFLEGREFNSKGLSVYLTYENGRKDVLEAADYTIDSSAYVKTTPGTYTITISNEDFTTSYDVVVYDAQSIEVADHVLDSKRVTHPLETVFLVNSEFTSKYLAVGVTAKNVATEETVTFILDSSEYAVSTPTMTSAGAQTVTVTAFETLTDTYQINIVNNVLNAEAEEVTIYVDAAASAVSVTTEDVIFKTVNDALRYLELCKLPDATIKVIKVAAGSYKEKVEVNLPNVHLIGTAETTETVVWYDRINGMTDPSGTSSYSTDGAASVSIRSTAVGFYAENITFKNYYNTHALYLESLKISSDSQATAVLVQADQSYFKNVRFTSYHDTLYAQIGRQYYENCYIEGRTDYIFGYNATAYFDGCTIHTIGAGVEEKNGGYVVATKGLSSGKGTDDVTYGYVFNECTFEADENTQAGSVSIARGWAECMTIMVMNSKISGAFSKEVYGNDESKLNDRYTKMNAGPTPSLLFEYNNTGDGALVVPTDNAETTDVNEAEVFIKQYAEATCTIVTDEAVAAKYLDLLTVFAQDNGNVHWVEAWGGNLDKNATITFKNHKDEVIKTLPSYIGVTLTEKQIETALVNAVPAGFKPAGYYTDLKLTTTYNLSSPVTAETVIYVKYESSAVLEHTTLNISNLTLGDVKTKLAVNDIISLVGSDSKKLTIDTNDKKVTDAWGNEYKSTQRIKTGGKTDSSGRYIIIDLTKYSGYATIQIWAASATSGEDRTGQVRLSSLEGASVKEINATGSGVALTEALVECGYEYYLTADASMNFHGINIVPDTTINKNTTYTFDGTDWTETYSGVNVVVKNLVIKAATPRVTYKTAEVVVGEVVTANTYYELVEEKYTLTTDTTFAEGKTYYTQNQVTSELAPNNDWYRLKGNATISLYVKKGTTISHQTYNTLGLLLNGVELVKEDYDSNYCHTYTATQNGWITFSVSQNVTQAYFKYIKITVPLDENTEIPHHVAKTTYSFVTSATDGNYVSPAENVIVFDGSNIDYLTIDGAVKDNSNSIQLKGASIKFNVKANTLVTINGYPGYTDYTINNRIVTATTYQIYYTEDAEVVIKDNSNKYIVSIVIDPTAEPIAEATVSGIELIGVPTDPLLVGKDLDLSKLQVKVNYTDGSHIMVSEGFTNDAETTVNKDAAGTYNVKVVYGDYDAEFEVVYVEDVDTFIRTTTSYTFKGGSYSGENLINANNDSSYKVSSTDTTNIEKLVVTGAVSNGNDNWLKINTGATIKFEHAQLGILNVCFYKGEANVTVTLNGTEVTPTSEGEGDKAVYTYVLTQPGEVVITSTKDNTYIGFLQIVVKPLISETISYTFKGGSYSGKNLVNANNDSSFKVSSTDTTTIDKLTLTGAVSNGNDNWLKINKDAIICLNTSDEANLNICFYKGEANVTVTLNGTEVTPTSEGEGDKAVYTYALTQPGEVVITSTKDNTYIGFLQVVVNNTYTLNCPALYAELELSKTKNLSEDVTYGEFTLSKGLRIKSDGFSANKTVSSINETNAVISFTTGQKASITITACHKDRVIYIYKYVDEILTLVDTLFTGDENATKVETLSLEDNTSYYIFFNDKDATEVSVEPKLVELSITQIK